MKRVAFLAGLLFACGGTPENRGNCVTGTIVYETIEGGFWAIRGDDGTTYDPTSLADQYKTQGLRVAATIVVRPDLASFHAVGPIVDVVAITPGGTCAKGR